MKRFFYEKFRINPRQTLKINQYDALSDGKYYYIIVKVDESEQEQLIERFEMAEYLREMGEKFVPTFVIGNDKKYIQKWENDYYLLLKLDNWRNKPYQSLASPLAFFHRKGFTLQTDIKKLNRVGKWKQLWEKRLDGLQTIWQQTVMNRPTNEFEKLFIESFPYYAGLTENAIQYFVDTTLDGEPQTFDAGTICHERFHNQTWKGSIVWKNPFDWIIDHPTRDLAEWTRALYFEQNRYTFVESLQRFYQEYQYNLPLSSFGWRLLYSRLLLPLHYFQCIETYLARGTDLNRTMENLLNQYLDQSDEYEQFLAHFYEMAQVPVQLNNIPKLDWLKQ